MRDIQAKREKLSRLYDVFRYNSSLLIVMQNNPDPDSIASAAALRKLANVFNGIQCSIIHGGTIGRSENRALAKYLALNLRDYFNLDFSSYDITAMVDTQPGAGNNAYPIDVLPDIVIDHHSINSQTRKCRFTDIRSRYGATSTIMYEYLKIAGIEPETKLATALLYGIRSDTQDLGRNTTRADIEALHELYKFANTKILSNIQRGKVQRDYFQMLSNALSNARFFSNSIICSLGHITNPDMIAEVSDLLLRDNETCWTMVYGFTKKAMLISIRTSQDILSAEKVVKKIVARKGTGGGHPNYAGGQIPFKEYTMKEISELEKAVRNRFLEAINETSTRSVPLIKHMKPIVEPSEVKEQQAEAKKESE